MHDQLEKGTTMPASTATNTALARGEVITIAEASRRTGLTFAELVTRINSGTLPSRKALVVSTGDLATEVDAHSMRGITELTERVAGEPLTPERQEQLFGPHADRLARLGGQEVTA